MLGANGEKLSKQNGATALSLDDPLAALRSAGAVLGLVPPGEGTSANAGEWLAAAVLAWRAGMMAA